ncbi:putative NBD/HSP70 family sugar kinase [Saccharopolyspora lacisalsi]|uniref:Putative NBD/HSP70 family sugar kinase n=1 Tax=Halosaccharopolyspora lacisalsi TaxID=1000566 RepID=A0A839DZQ5_9PSEU|nr:ROK family transcriptional regulator [Halosaccharopolyspora lacisalsi]MBA8824895.1 putative NBD/HSP70 family sugar kinase [Halosaccharopolyspora lacisalsi]
MGWRPVRLAVPRMSGRADGNLVYSSLARLIASGTADSRVELVRAVGLARSTVNTHLDALLAAGVVVESGAKGDGGRGRPAHRLALAPRAGVVVVADVGVHSTRLAVADLGQQVLAQDQVALEIGLGPERALDALSDELRKLLAASSVRPHEVKALVMGLPGPVDSRMGMPVRPPIMPGWDGFPVGQTMGQRFSCAPMVDNDVNLMALGEARALPSEQTPLLFLKIGTGVGGGVVSNAGEVHRGSDGAAGDIGHIQVPGAGEVVCRCGNVGCVEAVASAGAVLDHLRVEGGGPETVEDLVRLLRDGEARAVRLVRSAATVLGEVVAMLVHFYNPRTVVLGGAVTTASDDVLAGIRSVVYRRALPLATRHLSLSNSVLGRSAGLAGAVAVGIEKVLSPEGITTLMDRGR